MGIKRTIVYSFAAMLAAGAALMAPGLTSPAAAATLTEVTNFGNNPGNMRMHVYVPDSRPANPAIVVAMHGCGGSGPGFYASSEFASLADRYGFIVIYPTATQSAGFGNCFDTWSAAAKQRNGGSDPVSIMSMITYVQQQYGGDPNRVYATGSSSGGMMTNHMLALYPDVFRAGAAFMGVPFDCFANAADYPPGVSRCTSGSMDRTPQEWGDSVRRVNPGYSGPWPRMQLWHGTNDTLVPYQLLQEAVEQWTNVHGLSQNPTSSDTPQPGWNRRRYADSSGNVLVEAYSIQGAGHSLPSGGMAAVAIAFFALDGSTPPPPPPPSTQPPPSSPPPPPPPSTEPPPSSPPPVGGACTATYQQINSWPGGFQGEVTVQAGAAGLNGWTVDMTFPAGTTVTQLWNGTLSGNGPSYTVRNVDWNGTVGPNGTVSFGFLGGGTAAAPTLTCTSP